MISQPKWLHGTARIVPQKEVLFSYLFVLFSPVPAISTLLLATVYEHIHLRQPNRMQGDVFSDLAVPCRICVAGVLNNTKDSSEDTKVVRQVTEVFVHEGFVYGPLVNDIAIMKVSPGFPTDNSAVKAIPLRQDVPPDRLICTVSGWGSLGDSDGTMPQILQVVMVPFITYDPCRDIYSNYTEGSIEPGMNCAGFLQGGKDACG
ncbi:hypothetical protein Cfor_04119, partial [Coptotermes formosanus]